MRNYEQIRKILKKAPPDIARRIMEMLCQICLKKQRSMNNR